MQENTIYERKTANIIRYGLFACCEAFALGSLIYTIILGDMTRTLMCIGTFLFVALPFIAKAIFKMELSLGLFVFCEIYALGPLLGHVYKLYYHTTWWDDILHASGGVVFAIVGVFFAEQLNKKGETSFAMKAVFALVFSIAIAAVWEFIEYGSDMLFLTDMQNDTVIHRFSSYLLGGELGQTGTFENIQEVLINGQPLSINGYLDIGLHDTMHDMLIETLGAVVFFIIYIIDKGKHPLISTTKRKK